MNLFGLRGFFSLILGEENGTYISIVYFQDLCLLCSYVSSCVWPSYYFLEIAATDDTQKMMQMGGQMGGFGMDPSKVGGFYSLL